MKGWLKEFERVADKTIKPTFIHNVDYQDALVHIIIDSYKEFIAKGHQVPQVVKAATKEWTGDVGSVEGFLSMRYDITRNENDYVSAREIIEYLTKEKKVKMSDTKIGRELAGLKLIKDDVKLKGKSTRVWRGLKESSDGYMMYDDGEDDLD